MELIVYHDDNYPTAWIPREVSKKITRFLKSKDFVEHNAEDLAKWMEKSIDEETCRQSVVVFSQDIVPDTICHTPSPSSLIREYLDCGGRVVWIGDIPFFYFGLHPSRPQTQYAEERLSPLLKPISEEEFKKLGVFKDKNGKFAKYWGVGGCFSILGVMPLYLDFPSSKVSITKRGKSFGLQNPWYSIRPILLGGSNLRKKKTIVLATTKPLSLISTKKTIFRARVRRLREVEERGITFPSIMDALSKSFGPILTLVGAMASIVAGLRGFAGVPLLVWFAIAGLFLLALVLWFFQRRERLASAWFKNFNKQHPTSGFIRLWDFKLHRITYTMLEELYNVAVAGTKM